MEPILFNTMTNEFAPMMITAPANTPVTVTFTNNNNLAPPPDLTPHNLMFGAPINRQTPELVAAGASATLNTFTPAVGSYTYFCSLHSGMTGTLIVR